MQKLETIGQSYEFYDDTRSLKWSWNHRWLKMAATWDGDVVSDYDLVRNPTCYIDSGGDLRYLFLLLFDIYNDFCVIYR